MPKICLSISLVILLLQIILVNQFAELGEKMVVLKNKSHNLNIENLDINRKILALTSITNLDQKAQEKGMALSKISFEKFATHLARAYESGQN